MIERYRVELSAAAQRDLKGFRHAVNPILDVLSRLESDPTRGHNLSGDLGGLRAIEIFVKGSGAFRAAYEVDEVELTCLVVAIGPHEGFYERLRRRMKG